MRCTSHLNKTSDLATKQERSSELNISARCSYWPYLVISPRVSTLRPLQTEGRSLQVARSKCELGLLSGAASGRIAVPGMEMHLSFFIKETVSGPGKACKAWTSQGLAAPDHAKLCVDQQYSPLSELPEQGEKHKGNCCCSHCAVQACSTEPACL